MCNMHEIVPIQYCSTIRAKFIIQWGFIIQWRFLRECNPGTDTNPKEGDWEKQELTAPVAKHIQLSTSMEAVSNVKGIIV